MAASKAYLLCRLKKEASCIKHCQDASPTHYSNYSKEEL